MATPGEETRKLAREVGQRSVGQLEAGLARVMGETGANHRWLLGALVLLNGGGIAVAAAQIDRLDPRVLEGAISLLVIGAALAVLGALAAALFALLLSRRIGAASALWTEVANSGEVSEAALKAAGKVRQTGLFTSLLTVGIGFLSLVLFVGGALTLASGLAGKTSAAEEEPAPAAPMNAAVPPLPERTPLARLAPPSNAAEPAAEARTEEDKAAEDKKSQSKPASDTKASTPKADAKASPAKSTSSSKPEAKAAPAKPAAAKPAPAAPKAEPARPAAPRPTPAPTSPAPAASSPPAAPAPTPAPAAAAPSGQ